MTDASDWIWFGSAAILGAVALVLGAWALLWDRSRERLRCPRCWYSMDGIVSAPDARGARSWTCPECGRTSRREKHLRRTRRRWRWACAAGVLLYTAAQVALAPTHGREGWWRIVPTCVLALRADYSNWSRPTTDHLSRRLVSGFVFPWDRELARRLELRNLPVSWDGAVLTRERWPVEVPLRVAFNAQGQRWMWSIGDWRSIEMTPAMMGSPVAVRHMSPPGIISDAWGPGPPDFLDLPPPGLGANTYGVDLVLKMGERVLARRRVQLRVVGVTQIGEVVTPVQPGFRHQVGRALRFGCSVASQRRCIWVSIDTNLWQRADFTRCFCARLWSGQTLLGESTLDGIEAVFPIDMESDAIAGLLREEGSYLDISGMQLEIGPDEIAALRDLRRSTYSDERTIIPLRSIPFVGVASDGSAIRLRGDTIPLTGHPSESWRLENGLQSGGG